MSEIETLVSAHADARANVVERAGHIKCAKLLGFLEAEGNALAALVAHVSKIPTPDPLATIASAISRPRVQITDVKEAPEDPKPEAIPS